MGRADIEKTSATLAKEEAQYDKHTKALIWYTVPLMARERNVNLNKAFSALAAISASSASAAYTSSIKVRGSALLPTPRLPYRGSRVP